MYKETKETIRSSYTARRIRCIFNFHVRRIYSVYHKVVIQFRFAIRTLFKNNFNFYYFGTTFSVAVKNPFVGNASLCLHSKHRWIVNVAWRGGKDRELNRLTIAGRSPNRLHHPSQFRRSFPNEESEVFFRRFQTSSISPPPPIVSIVASRTRSSHTLATPKGCGGWKAQTLAKGDAKDVAVYIRPPLLPVPLEFFGSLRHPIRNSPNSPSARKCVSWRERVSLARRLLSSPPPPPSPSRNESIFPVFIFTILSFVSISSRRKPPNFVEKLFRCNIGCVNKLFFRPNSRFYYM